MWRIRKKKLFLFSFHLLHLNLPQEVDFRAVCPPPPANAASTSNPRAILRLLPSARPKHLTRGRTDGRTVSLSPNGPNGTKPKPGRTKYSLHTVRGIYTGALNGTGTPRVQREEGGLLLRGGGCALLYKSSESKAKKERFKPNFFFSGFFFLFFFVLHLSSRSSTRRATALVSVAKNPSEFPASTS